jgi:hypothetical protein
MIAGDGKDILHTLQLQGFANEVTTGDLLRAAHGDLLEWSISQAYLRLSLHAARP